MNINGNITHTDLTKVMETAYIKPEQAELANIIQRLRLLNTYLLHFLKRKDISLMSLISGLMRLLQIK